MKEIIIQGTSHPIHFGLRAIDEFVKQRGAEFGQTVASTDALGSLDSIVALTATGLNEGARRAGSDRRYAEDEVWDIFDEEPSLILAVSELFVESTAPLTDKLGDLSKKRETPDDEEPQPVTYERWFAIAVGQMGLAPAEFIYAWLGWATGSGRHGNANGGRYGLRPASSSTAKTAAR